MTASGMVEPRHYVPDDEGHRSIIEVVFELFKLFPVASALLIWVFNVEAVTLVNMVAKTLGLGVQPDVLASFSVALLAAGELAALRWWRFAGFNRPSAWRSLHLLWLPALAILAVPILGGVQVASQTDLIYFVAVYVLVGFREEALYRGILLHVLGQTGPRRAVIFSAVLFGLSHLASILVLSPGMALLQMAAAFGIGVGLGALRLRMNTIWFALAFHGLYALLLHLSPLPAVTLSLIPAALLLLFGLYQLRDPHALRNGSLANALQLEKPIRVDRAMMM